MPKPVISSSSAPRFPPVVSPPHARSLASSSPLDASAPTRPSPVARATRHPRPAPAALPRAPTNGAKLPPAASATASPTPFSLSQSGLLTPGVPPYVPGTPGPLASAPRPPAPAPLPPAHATLLPQRPTPHEAPGASAARIAAKHRTRCTPVPRSPSPS